jgi:hypothetical protein
LADLPTDREKLEHWLLDDDQPISRRRAVILVALDKVIVQPAAPGRSGRYDPDRLVPMWRA